MSVSSSSLRGRGSLLCASAHADQKHGFILNSQVDLSQLFCPDGSIDRPVNQDVSIVPFSSSFFFPPLISGLVLLMSRGGVDANDWSRLDFRS